MTAMLALDRARTAWERSQPQLQLFYGLVSGPTELTKAPRTATLGEHGAVGSLTSRSDGEPCGTSPLPDPADTRLPQVSVSSPSEHNKPGGAGTYREVSASTARQEEH